MCRRLCVCVHTLRIVSMEKIVHFVKTLIMIIVIKLHAHSVRNVKVAAGRPWPASSDAGGFCISSCSPSLRQLGF